MFIIIYPQFKHTIFSFLTLYYIHNNNMKSLVPEITPSSSFHDLTMFLSFSFQESERQMVEHILENREKGLREELTGVLERMLKEEVCFAALVKGKVESLIQSRLQFEKEINQKCHVLEQEVESLKKESPLGSAVEKRVVEDEKDFMRNKLLEEELKRSKMEVRKEMEKARESYEKELKQKREVESLKQSRLEFEEKMKEKYGVLEKELEGELETTRETYEKELKQQRDSAALVKMEVDNLIHSRVEFEEKMKEKQDVLEKEGELKRKVLEEEVERLKEKCEELKKETGLMKDTISMAYEEKRVMEDEMRAQRDRLESQNDVMHKGFKGELEKMRKSHDEGLRKLSLGVIEKLQLEKELKESGKQNEEARKKLEGELVKVKEICEKKLQRERDSSENMLILANLEKMNLEEELSKSKMYLEERIQLLEGDNLVLSKKLELHTKSFRNITEQIKQVYDSAISEIVRATELLGNGSNAAKRGCPFLENEPEVGANNENSLGLKCKRRRIINENEDDGIDHCSNNSGVDSPVISSGNTEVAGCQTEKKITWRQPADMLSAFKNDPELCMDYVCALYRQHISATNVSNKGLLSGIDIVSATAVVKYSANNDPENKLNRSLLEVQQDCPHVLEACFKLANQYKEQIFEMYQKKLDLLFCAKP